MFAYLYRQKLPRSFTNDCLPYIMFCFLWLASSNLNYVAFNIRAVLTTPAIIARHAALIVNERLMHLKCRNAHKEISKAKQSPQDILSREIENNHALINSHPSSQGY